MRVSVSLLRERAQYSEGREILGDCDVRVDTTLCTHGTRRVLERSGESGLPFRGKYARSMLWTWTFTVPERVKERYDPRWMYVERHRTSEGASALWYARGL